MSVGEDEFDRLAYALVNASFDFDAVERGGYRAEWAEDGTAITVTAMDDDETVAYTADDVAVATSDRELRDSRWPADLETP